MNPTIDINAFVRTKFVLLSNQSSEEEDNSHKMLDKSSELVDEDFETEQDAQDEYDSWLENWNAGKKTLMLAGEDYVDADIEDCDIWEE